MNCISVERKKQCLNCPFKKAWYVPCWHVGKNAEVLFVGKTARAPEKQSAEYWQKRAEVLFKNSSWSYWRYTREIVEHIFGESAWDKIAMTNLIKCNQGTTRDETPKEVREWCIVKNRFIEDEIKLICPKKIIFYTSSIYDRYLREIFQISHEKHEILSLGKKKVDFWFFKIELNGQKIVCLRTGHPERKKKKPFIK